MTTRTSPGFCTWRLYVPGLRSVSPAYWRAVSLIAWFAAAGSPNWNEQPTNFVAAGKRAGIDQRLEVLLVDVHVPDVHDDRREGEEHRDEQREEHDDLTPLAAAAVAARPSPPFPLHPSSPGRIPAHSASDSARM